MDSRGRRHPAGVTGLLEGQHHMFPMPMHRAALYRFTLAWQGLGRESTWQLQGRAALVPVLPNSTSGSAVHVLLRSTCGFHGMRHNLQMPCMFNMSSAHCTCTALHVLLQRTPAGIMAPTKAVSSP